MNFPVFALFALSVLASCASPTRQTDTFMKGPRDIPDYVEIPNVPFVKQTENFCGPATLSMVMGWAGKPKTVEELGVIYSEKDQGTLQTALIDGARKEGMLAVPFHGLPDLLHEVAAGHPVIVFENLALKWYTMYHYAVVIGYDLKEGNVILHTGGSESKHWSMKKFERSWLLGDYWGLIILPPDRLPATANELAVADAGAALEDMGKVPESEEVYQAMLKKWPGSLTALIGLGNTAYAKKDYAAAVRFLRKAVKLHPESGTAQANLKTALQTK